MQYRTLMLLYRVQWFFLYDDADNDDDDDDNNNPVILKQNPRNLISTFVKTN